MDNIFKGSYAVGFKGQAPGMLTGCEHNFAGFCLHVAVTRNKTQIQLLVVNIND